MWQLEKESIKQMKINGKTKVCGLIGYPIGHTMSPVIHNNLAEIYGHNLVYVPLQVEQGKLKAAIKGADAYDFLGMNVTVPYKTEVIQYLQEIDPLAESIGAVNTLVRTDGGYKGYNTDMPGLYRAMLSDGIVIEVREVIILGAGGVARAVAILLLQKKAKRIHIMNRTREKAQMIAEEINRKAEAEVCMAYDLDGYTKLDKSCKYLAVQATNVGMYPETDKAVIEDTEFYQMIEYGYDLIYNPGQTKFMKYVINAGGKSFNGLKMLLYQGIIANELWNGISIPEETALIIYEKLKKELA